MVRTTRALRSVARRARVPRAHGERERLLTRRSASSTRSGRRSRAPRTTSRCRSQTYTSRCTRRASAGGSGASKCRSAPTRCTRRPEHGIARTGSTRSKAAVSTAGRGARLAQAADGFQRSGSGRGSSTRWSISSAKVVIGHAEGRAGRCSRVARRKSTSRTIHSEVGDHCSDARVVLLQSSTSLPDGAATSRDPHLEHAAPEQDWLEVRRGSARRRKITPTSATRRRRSDQARARSRVDAPFHKARRQASRLHEEQRAEAADTGRCKVPGKQPRRSASAARSKRRRSTTFRGARRAISGNMKPLREDGPARVSRAAARATAASDRRTDDLVITSRNAAHAAGDAITSWICAQARHPSHHAARLLSDGNAKPRAPHRQ